MSIKMVGIDHNKANIDVRSVFSFTKKEMEKAYSSILRSYHLEGCLILSTCNRVELWMNTSDETKISPASLLCSLKGISREQYDDYIVERSGKEAVEHLFRLVCGLESKILGEDQIITQVREAHMLARTAAATDHVLEVLFRNAITAGKRVRTETVLSRADRSVIRTALESLKEKGICVCGKKCMVIGNGMMGRLSADTLLSESADVTVTIRQYHSGIVDVPSGCRRINYDERYEYLPECSLVVSATSSPNYTITKEQMDKIMLDHPVTILDLAVPRDVEPDVSENPSVSLYDIDSFGIDINSEKVKSNIDKAQQIIAEEMKHFYEWYEGKDLVLRIRDIKDFSGNDTVLRMAPVLKHSSLDEKEREELAKEIKSASSRMMNHLLFSLRGQVSDDSFREFVDKMILISEERVRSWKDQKIIYGKEKENEYEYSPKETEDI